MTAVIDGVHIPDTKLCTDITEIVRQAEPEFLFRHSTRVFFFGAIIGQNRGVHFDRELLYAAAMFHDIGLMPEHSSPTERFEVDGARTARGFLESRGVTPADLDLVWSAIALHTTPGIPAHMHPLIALVSAGIKTDVLGAPFPEVAKASRDRVVGILPRSSRFEEDMLQAVYDGIKHKPETAYGTIDADVLADQDPHFRRSGC